MFLDGFRPLDGVFQDRAAVGGLRFKTGPMLEAWNPSDGVLARFLWIHQGFYECKDNQ